MPDEVSNEAVRILNHGTSCRKTSTTTSRKPLSRDTNNSVELYAWSQIQVAEEQGILEGKIVHAHSNGCMMGEELVLIPVRLDSLTITQTLVESRSY